MTTILVPTDFSKCAANALAYAFEIAHRTGARIALLHVVFPNQGVENNIYEAFWIDDYVAERVKAVKRTVRKFQRNPLFKNIEVTTEVTIGFPVSEIYRFAKEIKADMIVMGTTGGTGLRGVFLGSIASGVLSKTNIPVLTVPLKGSFRSGANVVMATDFRIKIDARSIGVMKEVLAVQKSRLLVVNVMDKPGQQPDKSSESAFAQKLGDIQHDFHYLHDRDVPQAISNFLESTDANGLVTISHEHSLWHRLFFDSVTQKLAHRVQVPMLVLHDK